MKNKKYDAIIIGSGPNGLAAAIRLAQHQLSVLLIESRENVGGGVRTSELTLPGFKHDVCSAIHPLCLASPFFKTLPLEKYELEFINPPAALAHPLDDGTAVILRKSITETCSNLGTDAENYRKLVEIFVENWRELAPDILAPLRFPNHPLLLARFGLKAFRSAAKFAESHFSGNRARALFAGNAAHSMIPLEDVPSAAFGLVLLLTAHAVGWGFPKGGAGKISEALAAHFLALGGEIETNREAVNIDELPAARAILFDLTPRQIINIAGHRLPESYTRKLQKFKYGAAAFKIDFALSEPIPWISRECATAGTVHIGGTLEEIARSEREYSQGKTSQKPFVLVAQNSLFDDTRAPAGKHTGWAYCHVPNGSTVDMTEIIENQIERFAPGFRDCILAKSVMPPAALEKYNANYIGGDINSGAGLASQLFTRPVAKINPYSMPAENLYICSASTPPGGGVHGMCGFHAAQTALAKTFKIITQDMEKF